MDAWNEGGLKETVWNSKEQSMVRDGREVLQPCLALSLCLCWAVPSWNPVSIIPMALSNFSLLCWTPPRLCTWEGAPGSTSVLFLLAVSATKVTILCFHCLLETQVRILEDSGMPYASFVPQYLVS